MVSPPTGAVAKTPRHVVTPMPHHAKMRQPITQVRIREMHMPSWIKDKQLRVSLVLLCTGICILRAPVSLVLAQTCAETNVAPVETTERDDIRVSYDLAIYTVDGSHLPPRTSNTIFNTVQLLPSSPPKASAQRYLKRLRLQTVKRVDHVALRRVGAHPWLCGELWPRKDSWWLMPTKPTWSCCKL